MGHTLTLFGFLFESYDTFRQLVVSSTGPPDLRHYGLLPSGFIAFGLSLRGLLPSGMLPSGMWPSGLYLRVCAFGFVAL